MDRYSVRRLRRGGLVSLLTAGLLTAGLLAAIGAVAAGTAAFADESVVPAPEVHSIHGGPSLAWRQPGGPVAGWHISRNGAAPATLTWAEYEARPKPPVVEPVDPASPAGLPSYVDPTPLYSITRYTVTAFDSSGRESSPATFEYVPSPRNLRVTGLDPVTGTISLAWDKVGNYPDRRPPRGLKVRDYTVTYYWDDHISGPSFDVTATTTGGTFTVRDAKAGSDYYVRVVANDRNGVAGLAAGLRQIELRAG